MKVLSPSKIIYRGDFTTAASVRSVKLRPQTIIDLELEKNYVLATLPAWNTRFDDTQRFWIKEWLYKPLTEVRAINDRLDAVSALRSGELQQDKINKFFI
jgi:DNA mismatch repair ATPase MutS